MKAYAVASSAGKGHTNRCKLLIKALEPVDSIVNGNKFEALIIDTYDKEMAKLALAGYDRSKTIYIHIVDSGHDVHFPVDISVYPSARRQQQGWKQIVALNGSRFTLIAPEFHERLLHNPDSKRVLVVPGSAENAFWRTVNREQLEKEHDIVVCDGTWTREALIKEASESLFVCTAGGVTSLEMNALGKWNLLVKTADNQVANVMGLVTGRAAFVYSNHNINLASAFATRSIAPLCVNPQGAREVASRVNQYLLDFDIYKDKRDELGVGQP